MDENNKFLYRITMTILDIIKEECDADLECTEDSLLRCILSIPIVAHYQNDEQMLDLIAKTYITLVLRLYRQNENTNFKELLEVLSIEEISSDLEINVIKYEDMIKLLDDSVGSSRFNEDELFFLYASYQLLDISIYHGKTLSEALKMFIESEFSK